MARQQAVRFSADIDLDSLELVCPSIPVGHAEQCRQRCIVALDHHGHDIGADCDVYQDDDHAKRKLTWKAQPVDNLRAFYRNPFENAEDGACAISLLLASDVTGYSRVSQSKTGDRVDYHLTSDDDELIFNNSAFLEVSGILEDKTGSRIRERIKDKVDRIVNDRRSTLYTSPDSPTFVCVVEFSRPSANWVKV